MFLAVRLVIVVGLTFILFNYRHTSAETFSSAISSMPIDPVAIYRNTATYELENYKFEQALRNTFMNKSKNCPDVTDITSWTQKYEPTSSVNTAFETALKYLQTGIKSSKHFDLPGDSERFYHNSPARTPIPMNVHKPRLVSYKVKSNNPDVLLQIELVMHRDFKYQAKHVEFWVHVSGGQTNVVVANVVGVLFEDALENQMSIEANKAPGLSKHADPVTTIFPSESAPTKRQKPPTQITATCPYSG